jgi:hypothetical protein
VHRWGHAARKPGIAGTPVSLNEAKSAWLSGIGWARLDSNQGPSDYEEPKRVSVGLGRSGETA